MKCDTLLSSLLDPLEGLGMLNCGKLELGSRSQLPTLKGVRRACQKSRDQTRKKDNYLVTRSCIQNQPQVGYNLFCTLLMLGQATGNLGLTTARTRGKPPPSPIQYSLRCSTAPTPKWLFVPGLPKWGPEIVPVWTPRTLGHHNFSPRSSIRTSSEPILPCRTPPTHVGIGSIPDFLCSGVKLPI